MRARNCILPILLTALGCGGKPSAPAQPANSPVQPAGGSAELLVSVKLALNWYPEAEHGGYYAALNEGFYREAGLDVEIVKGGPNSPVIPLVARGQPEFGIYNADGLLLGRAQDAPVVALMAPLQTSPRCILVHASSGITDFDGLKTVKTLAISNSQPFYQFLRRHVDLDDVTIVPYSGSVAEFLLKPDYAQQGYVFSEPFVAEQQGSDPRSLMVAELGFNPYTSVLFTSEAYVRAHADVVAKLVEASVRGWQHYLTSPEPTNQYIHEVNPEMSLAALAYGIEALRPLVRGEADDEQGLGSMTRERWQTLADQLVEIEAIERSAVNVDQAFTTRFLPPGQP